MKKSLAALSAVALFTGSAHAVVVQNVSSEAASAWNSSTSHSGTIQALSGDLLETSVASFNDVTLGGPHDAGQHDVPSLTDGGIITGWSSPAGVYGSNGGQDYIEYNLDTSVNTLGYDISQLIIIQLSGDTNNRPYANVDIEFGFVGGGSSAIHSTGLVGSGTAFDVNKVDLTESGGLLGSGVNRIKYTFLSSKAGTTDNWTWYRELDAVGTATVPEPSSLALIGLGGLLIARRRRD